ncbi:MAG: radical SAM family heme chaperone HemW [Thiobacillaceae bacterium]
MAEYVLQPAGGLASPPPLALYVHLPWCMRKCPYCDFNSHPVPGEVPEEAYLKALERDLTSALPLVWGREITSVFIGGGTPSLFSPESIDRLLTLARTLLPVRPLAEITLEANPGSFEVERFRGYRAAGVNRLSLGIQSFNVRHLKALGRIHDDRQAHAAVQTAVDLFDRVNLDLMYALPDQTLAEVEADVRAALDYRPAHLSVYHLTLEPNTAFAAHPPPLPDVDLAADMQDAVEASLTAAGYEHYETSAYARPGQRCRHNVNYWEFGDYLGIGAGAHSKLSFHDRIVRQARVKHPRQYLDLAGTPQAMAESREVGRRDRPFEFMMNALRLTGGVPKALFTARTGLPLSAAAAAIAEAETRGLLTQDLTHIRPTERGRRYLNDLLQIFLD